MANLCVTGRLPFPGILILDVANEKLLRLIAHRRVRFFTFMFVSTLVLEAGGGAPLNLIQVLESIVILETHECTSSVST